MCTFRVDFVLYVLPEHVCANVWVCMSVQVCLCIFVCVRMLYWCALFMCVRFAFFGVCLGQVFCALFYIYCLCDHARTFIYIFYLSGCLFHVCFFVMSANVFVGEEVRL